MALARCSFCREPHITIRCPKLPFEVDQLRAKAEDLEAEVASLRSDKERLQQAFDYLQNCLLDASKTVPPEYDAFTIRRDWFASISENAFHIAAALNQEAPDVG